MVIVASVLISWVGFVVHNFADLPHTSFLDPNTLGPTLVWLVLTIVWLARRSRLSARLLFGWIALNLVGGGILSVLPLPILPFRPTQSLYHYAFHALYTIAQIPAVTLLVREIAPGRCGKTHGPEVATPNHIQPGATHEE